ncbi:hypothetical protein SDC9_84975 [bioreactor metagenome]|uniref:Uncharacterized protein n=1 Tax=bioreactor metagenome TaxID=1076179 RepID=A0A644ZBU8_9ZZZZ
MAQRVFVSVGTEARNHSGASRRSQRTLPEFLPGGDVADMHFDGGNSGSFQRIGNGDARMGVGRGIDDHAVDRLSGQDGIDPVDDRAFVIALEKFQFATGFGGDGAQPGFDIGQSRPAVDFRFAHTQKSEIRTVDYQNFHTSPKVVGLGAMPARPAQYTLLIYSRKIDFTNFAAGFYSATGRRVSSSVGGSSSVSSLAGSKSVAAADGEAGGAAPAGTVLLTAGGTAGAAAGAAGRVAR